MIRGLRHHPWMILTIVVTWLALQQSISPGTILVGLVLGLVLTYLWDKLDPPRVRMRHPVIMARLWWRVSLDILASNVEVARLIVLRQPYNPDFVIIDLELVQPTALSALACIVSATPGTVWICHDSSHRQLTLHVLNVTDATALINHIKQHYERPLLEIFQ